MQLTDIFGMVHEDKPLHAILTIGSGALRGSYMLKGFAVTSPARAPGDLPTAAFPTLSNKSSVLQSNPKARLVVHMTIKEEKSRAAAPTVRPTFMVEFSAFSNNGSLTFPVESDVTPFAAHEETPTSGELAVFTSGTATPQVTCSFMNGA